MSTHESNNRPSRRPSVAGKRSTRGNRPASNNSYSASQYSRDAYAGRRSGTPRRSTYTDPEDYAPARTGQYQSRYDDASRYSADRYAGRRSSHRPVSRTARPPRRGGGYEPLFDDDRGSDIGRSIRKRRALLKGGVALAIVAALIAGIAFFVTSSPITVTVNGMPMEISGEKTVKAAFEAAGEPAKAGNFVDVEGAVLEEGKGYRFSFAVNGQPGTDHKAKLKSGDAVVFSDGGNIEEDSDAVEEVLPCNVVDQGHGPIHVVQQPGTDGTKVTKTGKISGKTATQVTVEPQDRIYRRYYPDTGGEKVVALTFDDGPWDPHTSEILDILKENGAKATFFTVGERINGTGVDLVKREMAEGHQVCTHTYDHARGSGQSVSLALMSKDEQRDEITKGLQAVTDATGQEASKVVRSPGGNFPTEVWANVDDLITAEIGWDIDSQDWRQPGSDAIAAQLMAATPGDVILMHDGGGDRSQTAEALRKALPYLRDQGFRFITIDELMAYPWKDL